MKMTDINLDTSSAVLACSEIRKLMPEDLLPYMTVLFQNSGNVTISIGRLMRPDWIRINDQVRRLGGIWVSNSSYSHWSIPYLTQTH